MRRSASRLHAFRARGPHPTAAAARCKSHQGRARTAASTCTFSPSTSHVSSSQQHQSTTHVNTEGCRVADAFTQSRRSHVINAWGRSFHTCSGRMVHIYPMNNVINASSSQARRGPNAPSSSQRTLVSGSAFSRRST